MRRVWMGVAAAVVVLVGLGLGCGMGWGQTEAAQDGGGGAAAAGAGVPDAAVLREILAEVRGIHADVRLSQTTQILLTELEVEQGVVDKATQKRDDLRNRVSQLETNEKNLTAQSAMLEQNAGATIDPVAQKRMTDQEANLKAAAASLKGEEQDSANALVDAEGVLRKQQETLDGIQEQLNAVVKKLGGATGAPPGTSY